MRDNKIKDDEAARDKDQATRPQFIEDYEQLINSRFNEFNPVEAREIFHNLANPRFLGSYHLKQGNNPKYQTIDNLLKGQHELRYAKGLRSTVFNPLTIALILIALVFNLFWLFSLLF
jgi:hypothetical protein